MAIELQPGEVSSWPIISPWTCKCGYRFPEMQVWIDGDFDQPVDITFLVTCPDCKMEWSNTGPSERVS
jgi:hypothetical protein